MAYSTRARLQPSKTAIASISDETVVTTSTQKMKESPIKKKTSKITKTTESDNISKQSISPKRTTVKKTKNDPHALSSYFSKRGTVQYSYQISPTPRVFNPVDTSPLEPSSDKKVGKGRKKRKSDQAEIFDYISDDEEVLIPSIKKIKTSSVKQKAKKMSPVKPVAGTKRSISTAKKLEKAEVKEKPKQASGNKSRKGSNVRVVVSPAKKSVSKKPKSPKKVVKVVSQQTSTGKRVRGAGKPYAKTKRQEKEQPEKSKSETETGGGLRRANVRRRVLTKQRNASEEEDNETISKDEKEIDEEQKQLDDVIQKTEREPGNEIHVEEMEVEKIDDTTGEEEIPSEDHAPIDSLKNNSVKHDCEMEQEDEKNSDGESCNDTSLRQHVDSDDVENDLKKESTCKTCLVSTLDTGSEGRDELTASGTENDDDTLLDDRKEMECKATVSSGREMHLSRQSLDCAPDLSLTETESDFKRKSFDRHLKVTQTNIPSLARSSTWPKATSSSSHQIFSHPSQDKAHSLTVVRNVRQAHECLQHGENLQFRDEVEYLLDNMRPEQPLSLRCLSTLNLASECLKPDFSRQLRAHGLVNKILVLLKDALEHPSLQVVTATFFFVICQHRMDSSDLDRKCVELLNGLLEKSSDDIHDYSEQRKEDKGSLLEGKAAREYEKIKQKAKSVLEKCSPLPLKDKERGGGRTEDGKEEDEEEVIEVQTFDQDGLKPACLTISELVSECFHNLTSNQSNCHWIKEEMRILGTLDHVANIAIALSNTITWDESEEIDKKELLLKLLRSLKLLENVTFLNKGNQTYLTVFDGSLLISKLCKLIAFSQNLLIRNSAGNIYKFLSLECLLGVLRVLLNFTHDHELGSFRVGEQQDILESILDCIFKIPQFISGDRKFDMLILSLGLLINLVEHSAPNRQLLYTTEVNTSTVHGLGEVMDSKSAVNAVLELFLSHYKRAEDATIEVPTPQRLSQLTPTSSPLKGSPQMKRDFSATLASRLKSHKDVKGYRSPAKLHIDEGTTSQENEGNKDFEELEEEEEIEDQISADPLVFSREEFDTALTQAGRHMEDSIISSYSALLLAVLAKHSSEFAEILKEELPNRNYTSIISVLRDFIQFMNMAGSSSTRSGLESIRKIVKHLETLQD